METIVWSAVKDDRGTRITCKQTLGICRQIGICFFMRPHNVGSCNFFRTPSLAVRNFDTVFFLDVVDEIDRTVVGLATNFIGYLSGDKGRCCTEVAMRGGSKTGVVCCESSNDPDGRSADRGSIKTPGTIGSCTGELVAGFTGTLDTMFDSKFDGIFIDCIGEFLTRFKSLINGDFSGHFERCCGRNTVSVENEEVGGVVKPILNA